MYRGGAVTVRLSDTDTARADAVFRELEDLLPERFLFELRRLLYAREGGLMQLTELRLRAGAVSSAVIGGRSLPMFATACRAELERIADRLSEYSPYAFAEAMAQGYLTTEAGIRVGICRDKGSRGSLRSLVLRLPLHGCSYAEWLWRLWRERGRDGMLLFSAPGGGKTTALSALVRLIARRERLRVVVIDERCELPVAGFSDTTVDTVRGIPKAEGITMAARTLSPELIAADELATAEEAKALFDAGRGGVPLLVTAHADSCAELMLRPPARRLIDAGFFPCLVELRTDGVRYEAREVQL